MLTVVTLAEGRDAALSALPTTAGVGQIVDPNGRSLVLAPAANLRRWAATRLGAGPAPRPGQRPPVDLTPIAAELRYALTTSGFHQRLVFERLMAPLVPLSKRKDLKPPVWLHLDPAERFPRVSVRPHGPIAEGLYGPFRDRALANAAASALHKRYPLRACELVFEPHPELPVGHACLYAQVRSCAAPCLQRLGEDDYRALASEAAAFLAARARRPADVAEWCPPWVGPASGRGLIVEPRRDGLELYPVVDGTINEAHAITVAKDADPATVAGLRFEKAVAGDDTPWLSAWLHARGRPGRWIVPDGDAEVTAARVRTMHGA